LVNDPQLVFLDEPTTGLDPQARRAVWDVIRNLKSEDRCVLLTTHYLDEAQELADQVAIMNHGKIIAAGTPDQIIDQHGSGKPGESLEDVFVKLVGEEGRSDTGESVASAPRRMF